jgi:hypothetical protein
MLEDRILHTSRIILRLDVVTVQVKKKYPPKKEIQIFSPQKGCSRLNFLTRLLFPLVEDYPMS